jgi:hypothetical protein
MMPMKCAAAARIRAACGASTVETQSAITSGHADEWALPMHHRFTKSRI